MAERGLVMQAGSIRGHAARGLAALAILIAAPLAAQSGSPAEAELQTCRAIDDNRDRLSCYDTALDKIYGVDPELAETREERIADAFGKPKMSDQAPKELTAKIVSSDRNMTYGTTVIVLENGQQWQVLDKGILRSRFEAGEEVTIAPGPLGGYRLRIAGKQGYRTVIRVN